MQKEAQYCNVSSQVKMKAIQNTALLQ